MLLLAVLAIPAPALAVTEHARLDTAPIDIQDVVSIQRGAKVFVNYCLSCHSAKHMRYNRLTELGLTEEQIRDNLMFTAEKVGETIRVPLDTKQGRQWFGVAPPDLSVVARSRGADWLYTYLRTFYLDESRPWGVNNAVFPSVGMPHVLWELQGWQKPIHGTVHDASGEKKEVVTGVQLVEPGAMTQPEFDAAMADLVNFLAYIGEPAQLERKRIGWWVLGFLVLAFAVFYPLKKEYWKDVH